MMAMVQVQAQAMKQEASAAIAYASKPFGKTPFGGFAPETSRTLYAPQPVETDPRLEIMLQAWRKFCIDAPGGSTADDYDTALKLVSEIHCSARELELFVVCFSSGDEENAAGYGGLFISALVHAGPDRTYTVRTDCISTELDSLGFRNTKKLDVIGNAGSWAGWCMVKGIMTINGNVGDSVGGDMTGGRLIVTGNTSRRVGYRMKGGSILIHGNANIEAGDSMKGGKITIEGNVGDDAGKWMEGGTLVVKRNTGRLLGCEMKGGEIYVWGKAGSEVGEKMHGGDIHLNGGFVSLGRTPHGGRVLEGERNRFIPRCLY